MNTDRLIGILGIIATFLAIFIVVPDSKKIDLFNWSPQRVKILKYTAIVGLILSAIFLFRSINNLSPEQINQYIVQYKYYVLSALFIVVIILIFSVNERRREKNQILFFYPETKSGGRYNFWTSFADAFIKKVQESEFDVRSIPIDFYDDENVNIDNIINAITNNVEKYYSNGIVISSPVNNNIKFVEKIKQLIKEKKHKIVLHDLPHPNEVAKTDDGNLLLEYFSHENIARPPIISINNKEGGKIAAEILFKKLQEKRGNHPHKIYILKGNFDHIHSKLRAEGFSEKIRNLSSRKASVADFDFVGNWKRSETNVQFGAWIESHPNERIDGIFACNDEMALGICDSILNLQDFKQKESYANTLIVGFDNTNDIQLESKKCKNLVGTIDSNISEQAAATANAIIEIITDKSSKSESNLTIHDKLIKPKGIVFENH